MARTSWSPSPQCFLFEIASLGSQWLAHTTAVFFKNVRTLTSDDGNDVMMMMVFRYEVRAARIIQLKQCTPATLFTRERLAKRHYMLKRHAGHVLFMNPI